jgi:hypothetical protein
LVLALILQLEWASRRYIKWMARLLKVSFNAGLAEDVSARNKLAAYATRMDYQRFYKQLFQPIEERLGHVDEANIMAIMGFDCGGPVTLCTVGYGREQFVTYVTCELSVRDEQQPAEFGRYEVMMTCDDEAWARKILTKIGQM